MENSKLKDILKKLKIKKIIRFVRKHLRYFAAGTLFIVMMVVLATCASSEDTTKKTANGDDAAVVEEYQVDAYEDVNALIEQYYTAFAAGDVTTLSCIAMPLSANEQSYITMFSQYVEAYQNIKCYTKSGLDANSYLVSVSMEVKFAGVDTPAPGLDFFYVRTNEQGLLYIDNLYCQYNLANEENALDTSIQNLIYEFETQDDFVELQSEVQSRYNAAVEADANLSGLIYTTIPNAIDGWVTQITAQNAQTPSTEIPTEVVEETESVEEPSETPEETPEAPEEIPEETSKTYYATNKVNVREEASTDSERIGSVSRGSAVEVIGIEGDWSKIEYEDGEGYIKTEFLTSENPNGENDEEDDEEDESSSVNLAEGTKITLENTVNIRSGMSETSDKIGTAYRGEKVEVVMSYADGWTKVKWNGETGYIKSSLLQ